MNASARPAVNPWIIALTVTLATFMEVLDTSIANVALPHIAGNLSAGVDESTWVLTSYLVANAIILPLAGWLSEVFGRKNFYMMSVALFTVSSLLCGLAPSLPWLIFFRVLQGLGGGGLQPSEQAILADTFPAEQRGMGMAVYGVAVVTAPIIGPTLGGWITDNYSWHWIFLINIPVGLVSLFLTSRLISDPPDMRRRRLGEGHSIDGIGLGLIAIGLASLQFLLDKGQREDWFESRLIVTCAVVAGVALAAAVYRELTIDDPVVDLKLLKERNFFISNGLMFMLGMILYGSTVLLPEFMQTMLGYTATRAGEAMSPGGFATMISMPIVGMLLKRVQPRWLIIYGLCVVAGSLVYMGRFNLQIDFRTAMCARLFQACGTAFMFVPINTAAYSFVPKGKNNAASGIINLSRNMGASFGIAMVTTLQARFAQAHQNFLVAHATPYDAAYRAAAGTGGALQLQGVYNMILREAGALAYVDLFHLMAIVTLIGVPLALLLKGLDLKNATAAVH
jgi:DHA2 family multidrug resistance protein